MKNLKSNLIENAPFIFGAIVIIAIGVIWLIELFGTNPAIY